MHALVIGGDYGVSGREREGLAALAGGQDGGDEAVYVPALGFDHEDYSGLVGGLVGGFDGVGGGGGQGYARVVAEIGVWAVEHGEVGLEGGVSVVFRMDGEGWWLGFTMSSTQVPLYACAPLCQTSLS